MWVCFFCLSLWHPADFTRCCISSVQQHPDIIQWCIKWPNKNFLIIQPLILILLLHNWHSSTLWREEKPVYFTPHTIHEKTVIRDTLSWDQTRNALSCSPQYEIWLKTGNENFKEWDVSFILCHNLRGNL